ncbi:hypothetical protein [Winogradskyella sp.]
MKYNLKVILMVLLAIITIYGIVTGRYFFLFFMFPLGFGFWRKKDKH